MRKSILFSRALAALLLVLFLGIGSVFAQGENSPSGPDEAFKALPTFDMTFFVHTGRLLNEAVPTVIGRDRKIMDQFRASMTKLESLSSAKLSSAKYVVCGGSFNLAYPTSAVGLTVVQGDFGAIDFAGHLGIQV